MHTVTVPIYSRWSDGVEEIICSHRRLYQQSAQAGLYDDRFGEELAHLWDHNRTKTYYRLGIGPRSKPRRCTIRHQFPPRSRFYESD